MEYTICVLLWKCEAVCVGEEVRREGEMCRAEVLKSGM